MGDQGDLVLESVSSLENCSVQSVSVVTSAVVASAVLASAVVVRLPFLEMRSGEECLSSRLGVSMGSVPRM